MAIVAEKQIWQDLLAQGASSIQAAGIMGNMEFESSFDPEAIGDQGTSFGLVQQHGSQFRNLVTGSTSSDEKRQIQNIKGDFGLASGSTAAAAGSSFSANFEKCVGCQIGGTQNAKRSAAAQQIFNAAQTGKWPQQGSSGNAGGTNTQTLSFPNPLHWIDPINWLPGVGAKIAGSLNPIKWIEDALGIPSFKDILMRLGLILLGGIIIIVGVIVLAHQGNGGANADASEALQQLVQNEKQSKAVAGRTAVAESGATVAETAPLVAVA